MTEPTTTEKVAAANEAALTLANESGEARDVALHAVADALMANEERILAANETVVNRVKRNVAGAAALACEAQRRPVSRRGFSRSGWIGNLCPSLQPLPRLRVGSLLRR